MPDGTVRRGYADWLGRQLHYRIADGAEGKAAKPALLLCHPTPKSGWIFEPLMRKLAAGGRTVVAPDTPGYGASDPLDGEASIELYAAANFALIESLARSGDMSAAAVDVLGYHTGSVTSAVMARQRPDLMRRVVLVSIPAYDADQRAAKLASLASWLGPADDGSHLQRMWDLVGSLCDPRMPPAWKHRSVVENLRADDPPAGYAAVYRHDLHETLAGLSQRVLLLNPEDDLFEVTGKHRGLVKRAHYCEIPGAAHGLFERQADSIAAMVAAFLNAD